MLEPTNPRTGRPLALLALAALTVTPLAAQDDRAAGLFTEARQLPLVSQAVVVRIDGVDADLELTQVFANDGDGVAQADYRLHLPEEATVTAFGFWRGERFLEAELQEREAARVAHEAAASRGRATGLLVTEGRIHSFSVYPLEAGALQTVQTTLRLPVARERGRSHLRLPLDTFLGHTKVTSSVLVRLETREPLERLGVEGTSTTTVARGLRSARLAFAADSPTEIWWAEEAPPLSIRAEAVPLDDGSFAMQLRVALDEVVGSPAPYRELVILVDTSASMRRRGEALLDAVERIRAQSPVQPRVVSVAESAIEIDAADRMELARGLLGGSAGFSTTWDDLVLAGARFGCEDPEVRCVTLTDPQVLGLHRERHAPLAILFLADADEIAHHDEILGTESAVHQPDAHSRGELMARVDEMVLPVLEILEIDQPGGTLEIPGHPHTRVAEGGMTRIFTRSRSTEALEVGFVVGDRAERRTTPVEILDPDTRQGRTLRRGLYATLLNQWTRDYRRSRDPDLRQQIVDISLREEIPTAFTSLHVADEMAAGILPATATPAPLLRSIGALLLALGAGGAWLTRRRA